MIKEFKKSVAYICPCCSSITVKEVNLFDFSGSGTALFGCGNKCGEKCISLTPKKDKYSITVNCPMCEEPHNFNIKRESFWKNNFFVLRCPETDIGIFFVGPKDRVTREIELQEEMFTQMNEEFSVSEELSTIFDTVERINEIAKGGNVYCSCGSSLISIEIDNEKITLRCRECGAVKDFPTTEETLDMLLNTSTIVLE